MSLRAAGYTCLASMLSTRLIRLHLKSWRFWINSLTIVQSGTYFSCCCCFSISLFRFINYTDKCGPSFLFYTKSKFHSLLDHTYVEYFITLNGIRRAAYLIHLIFGGYSVYSIFNNSDLHQCLGQLLFSYYVFNKWNI